MATMVKQTAFRFTSEDLALLDAIQQHTGIGTRTDALRAVIREYARAEGLEVKRTRKPR
jgi:predicted DNA-binding protein